MLPSATQLRLQVSQPAFLSKKELVSQEELAEVEEIVDPAPLHSDQKGLVCNVVGPASGSVNLEWVDLAFNKR